MALFQLYVVELVQHIYPPKNTNTYDPDSPPAELQGSQEQEVKFQDIFVGFTKLKTQKMHFFCAHKS